MKMRSCEHLIVMLLTIFSLPVLSWAIGYTETEYPVVLVRC